MLCYFLQFTNLYNVKHLVTSLCTCIMWRYFLHCVTSLCTISNIVLLPFVICRVIAGWCSPNFPSYNLWTSAVSQKQTRKLQTLGIKWTALEQRRKRKWKKTNKKHHPIVVVKLLYFSQHIFKAFSVLLSLVEHSLVITFSKCISDYNIQ